VETAENYDHGSVRGKYIASLALRSLCCSWRFFKRRDGSANAGTQFKRDIYRLVCIVDDLRYESRWNSVIGLVHASVLKMIARIFNDVPLLYVKAFARSHSFPSLTI
jgi:hypothetical protein